MFIFLGKMEKKATKPNLMQTEDSETESGEDDMDTIAADLEYHANKSVKIERDPLKVEPGVNPESGEKPMVVNADYSDDNNQASDNSIIEVDQSPFNPRTIKEGLEARVVLTDIRFTGELAAATTRRVVSKKKKAVGKKTKKLVEYKVRRKPGRKPKLKIISPKAPLVPERDPSNPWDVRVVSEFLYYCCPECPVRTKKLSKFLKHANEKHDNFNKVCRSIHVRNPPVVISRREPKVPFEEWINTVDEEVEKKTSTLPNKRPRTDSEGEPFMAFEEVQVYCELDLGANHVIFPPNKQVVEIDASEDEDLICPPHVYLKPIGRLPQVSLDQPIFVPPQTPTVQTMVVPLLQTVPSMVVEAPDESIMDTMPFLEEFLAQEPLTVVPDIPELPTEELEMLDPENEVRRAEDGLYQCDGCNFKAKDLQPLRWHWKVHAKEDTFCRVCGLRCDNDGLQLVKHYQELHPFTNLPHKHPLFKCTDCEVTCKGVIATSKHMREEHKHTYKPYLCPHCQEPTYHFKLNSLHFYKHVDDGEIEPDPKTLPPRYPHVKKERRPCEYLCPDCGKVSKDKAAFRSHKKMVHNINGPREFKCSQCDFVARKANSLWNHKRKVHEPEKHSSCQYCQKSFYILSSLNNHIEEQHQDEITNSDYICDRCGKNFLQKCSIERHNKDFGMCGAQSKLTGLNAYKKTAWQNDPITCYQCDSTLLNIKQFLEHFKRRHDGLVMRAHGREVYPCFPCSKVFVTIAGLEIHNCSVHKTGRGKRCPDCNIICIGQHNCNGKKGVKQFKCFYCDYKQTTRDGMKDHILFEHHGEDIPFKCGQCMKTFAFKDQLSSHIDNHHKNVTCDLCDQTLVSPWEFRRHQVFVHNIRHGLYFCNHCPKKLFVNKSRLEKHMFEKHGDDSDSD
jgi:hypothetical protein